MTRRLPSRCLAGALAGSLLLAASPASLAGDNMTASETSSVLTVLSPMLVISIPAMLSATVAMNASAASDHLSTGNGRDGQKPRPTPAAVPDMEVKAIQDREDGGREVLLQDPANPENTAQLQWPARQDDPAGNFRVGQNVAFTSSEEGSGWLLRDGSAQGQALAFVPTGQAMLNNHSDTLLPQ